MRIAIAVIVVIAAASLAAQTARPRQQRQPPARIEGKFVDAMRSSPLRGVDIALERVNIPGQFIEPRPGVTSRVFSASSDGNGHFEITGITPGRYQVRIEKTGFLAGRQAHNILANNALLDLGASEEITDITVPLWPAAVLRGKVLEPSGEPLAGAKVLALRMRNGKARPRRMGISFSDDQGDYRIYGLDPGRYYLAAVPRAGIRQSPSKSRDEVQPVATFYPGRSDVSQALPINLRAGDELPVNIMLTTDRTVHVRGQVSSPIPPTAVMLQAVDELSAGSVAKVDDQNRFDVAGVAPGRYLLTRDRDRGRYARGLPGGAIDRGGGRWR